MNSNEIFEIIYEQVDGRIIGGDLGCQDETKEWVSGFLATLENYRELIGYSLACCNSIKQ